MGKEDRADAPLLSCSVVRPGTNHFGGAQTSHLSDTNWGNASPEPDALRRGLGCYPRGRTRHPRAELSTDPDLTEFLGTG
jgi:hypothetical protein